MKRETATILARHSLFRRLSQAEKAALLRLIVEDEVETNTLVFQEGSTGDSLYVVVTGSVLIQRDLDDTPAPIVQLQPGESFGELAVLSPGNRLVTAKSTSPAVIARLSHGALGALAEKHPAAAQSIRDRVLDHFLIKLRHLQPFWEALLRVGLEALEDQPLSRR